MTKLSPKAVIFDLGSTIIDFPVTNWNEVSRECSLNGLRTLLEAGYELPDEEEFLNSFEAVRARFRQNSIETHKEWTVEQAAAELLGDLGIDSPDKLGMTFFDAFYQSLEKHLSLYNDSLEVLTKIRSRFDKVGLISNTIFPEKVHHHEFERFGLKTFFDFTIFSSTFGMRKPHPSIFEKAAELAGHSPSDCVYIGDRFLEDFQGATGAGMSAILKIIPDREYPTDMPENMRRIESLSDLSRHFDI